MGSTFMKIKFSDETNDPDDHDRDNDLCKRCDYGPLVDRECEFCGGVLHIETSEGSDIPSQRCGKCGYELYNEDKYL